MKKGFIREVDWKMIRLKERGFKFLERDKSIIEFINEFAL